MSKIFLILLSLFLFTPTVVAPASLFLLPDCKSPQGSNSFSLPTGDFTIKNLAEVPKGKSVVDLAGKVFSVRVADSERVLFSSEVIGDDWRITGTVEEIDGKHNEAAPQETCQNETRNDYTFRTCCYNLKELVREGAEGKPVSLVRSLQQE